MGKLAASGGNDFSCETTDKAQFTVNGRTVTLPTNLPIDTTLNEFLRNNLHLTGTKVMCREGGCGACVVSVRRPDVPTSTKLISMSVNSCLTPVLSCRDWQITTIEGIGSSSAPHMIQQQIAAFHGTQCGYCTPGFCMQQYALMQQRPQANTAGEKQRIEDSMDGNICRCTGYRPILDAMKSLSSASVDMEDLANTATLKDEPKFDRKKLFLYRQSNLSEEFVATPTENVPWIAPATVDQLREILPTFTNRNIRFVAGSTGEGVYRDGPYEAYIDLTNVPELTVRTITADCMEFGSLITINKLIDIFEDEGPKNAGFGYLTRIAAHLRNVASTSVRNVGTWAGNLMLKKHHNEFPSDLFVCFAAVGAQLIVLDLVGGAIGAPIDFETFILAEFSMNNKIIQNLILHPLPADAFVATYKVMPRAVNAHALVNAAMVLKLDKSKRGLIEKPTLIFGNISSTFIHASATETLLGSGQLKLAEWSSNNNLFSDVFDTLRGEVQPTMEDPANASPEYRRSLCSALLYKFLLDAAKHCGLAMNAKHESCAIGRIDRPLSSGKQTFGTDRTQWPVTKPVSKIEGLIQATGEAEYVADIIAPTNRIGPCLHAVPVLATRGAARIDSIDTSEAEKVAGYVRIVLEKDIIGKNNIKPPTPFPPKPQKFLAAGNEAEYAGQLIGFVLAENEHAARACAAAVRVNLTPTRKAIGTCEEAIAAKAFLNVYEPDVVRGDAAEALKKCISYNGRVRLGGQYHFYLETHSALCEPQDNGSLLIHAASQWPDFAQNAAAIVCGMRASDIDIQTRRLGGGFGGKSTYANFTVCIAALGAKLTKRPVKCHLNMYDNTRMLFGGRHSYVYDYEVGLDAETKKLQAIKLTAYCNVGNAATDYVYPFQRFNADNVYKCPNWLIHPVVCKTDTPPKTYTRAPGSTEVIFIMEHIMERCAFELGMDPLEFRQLNFYQKTDMSLHKHPMTNFNVPEILEQLRSEANLAGRKAEISSFNAANRWKKRALSVVPLMYSHGYTMFNYASLVSIHHLDGTVSVSIGAVDMGQGINTKVAQCVARQLGLQDMDMVRIKPTTSLIAGNSFVTAASVPSELAVRSAIEACKALNKRILPVREKLGGASAAWLDVVTKCYEQSIDLAERYWIIGAEHQSPEQNGDAYEICACMATEIELDILTGERQIRRIDLVYDAGESVSPAIDIGQAEGAVVMGLGLFTSEEEKRSKETGELLSYNTWNYKPPTAKDIPVDMRISFLANVPNKLGALRSKTVSEPPVNLACSVLFALSQAVDEARRDAAQGEKVKWIEMDAPATCEQVQLLCRLESQHFTL